MPGAFMGGQWLTATKLAYRADVSCSTGSGHPGQAGCRNLLDEIELTRRDAVARQHLADGVDQAVLRDRELRL
jgi:hypothetical protein